MTSTVEVTSQMVAALEAGTPPWRRPWDENKTGGPMMPQNATTGVRYRGVNTIMLGMSPLAFASGDPRWATYKQAADRGWQVRRGSHGPPGFFYKRIQRYPSDLTDAEWEQIKPLLPDAPTRGRRRAVGLREMLNAIRYMVRSAGGWRMLPTDFGPWQTVYRWFRRLCGCCCSGPFMTSP